MYVWTKKAETDYRAKHPHRKNERKAGTEALWENKPLDRTIVEGYAERGWICEVVNIITTNCTMNELKDRIGERTASRIIEMTTPYKITASDYRLKVRA